MTLTQDVATLLHEENANFVVSVPCKLLDELIRLVEKDSRFQHLPVTREEEGVGVCAGTALTGTFPVLTMQNSGIGNSINAFASLTLFYELPLLLLVSHRGTPGEKIGAQFPMGKATTKLLEAVGIEYFILETAEDIDLIRDALHKAKKESKPVAVLLPFSFWGVNQ